MSSIAHSVHIFLETHRSPRRPFDLLEIKFMIKPSLIAYLEVFNNNDIDHPNLFRTAQVKWRFPPKPDKISTLKDFLTSKRVKLPFAA